MKYYNEVKIERSIRRKAIGITVSILFLMGTATAVLISEKPEEFLPDFVKEWFEETPVKENKVLKERA